MRWIWSELNMKRGAPAAAATIAGVALAVMSASALAQRGERAAVKPAPAKALKPLTDPKSLAAGKALFEPPNLCATCHRADLGGLIGPDLTDPSWMHGCAIADVMTSIREGFPLKGMLPFGGGRPLTDTELQQAASYILAKKGSKPPNPKAPDATREKPCK